ncbi:hypothetical protein BU23DRAFT_318748 [Bimuria novae-zelandiae CBS 107.79]|uniref:Uncharacterized protein n=1 Tax=Bimuria novae-zelandiae CBS 107.79 TaxID=1447943 RepID=A0A6A5VJ80_9PLEO|nr:hypothetical protein BU23DRAFT_318748 [Bimuria novae-zelandiae CBS 107.79]
MAVPDCSRQSRPDYGFPCWEVTEILRPGCLWDAAETKLDTFAHIVVKLHHLRALILVFHYTPAPIVHPNKEELGHLTPYEALAFLVHRKLAEASANAGQDAFRVDKICFMFKKQPLDAIPHFGCHIDKLPQTKPGDTGKKPVESAKKPTDSAAVGDTLNYAENTSHDIDEEPSYTEASSNTEAPSDTEADSDVEDYTEQDRWIDDVDDVDNEDLF